MVKIAHLSDLHWRSLSRHQEYTRAFKLLFDELREIKPDLIVNTGDTYHHKTSNLSAEVFDKLAWMFNELSSIAPTITILGNHDGNLVNKDRQDSISPIINAINNPNCYLLKQSISKVFEINGKKIAFHPYSPFDKESWDKLKPIDDCINIALFHGSVTGCVTDTFWDMGKGEKDVSFFTQYDYAFLGDIHAQQHLGYKQAEEIVSEEDLEAYKKLYGESNIEIIEEFIE